MASVLSLSPTDVRTGLRRATRRVVVAGRLLRATMGNPLDGLPPEIFTEPMVQRHLLHRSVSYVMAPDLVHEALVSHARDLDKGDTVRRPLGPALGNGLLTAEGEDWRWQRRTVAPVFRPAGLSRFTPPMLAAAEATATRLASQSPDGPDGIGIDIGAETMRVTFEIIVETMLSGGDGLDVAATARGVEQYLHQTRWANLANILGLPRWAPLPGQRSSRRIAAALRDQLGARVVQRRRDEGRCEEGSGNDLLRLLMAASDPETGRTLSDNEIVDNLLTFVAAGHETTALSLAWTLDLLGRHPEIARRLHAEAMLAAPGDVSALPLTMRVVQEGLRLYPAAPMFARRVAQPFALGDVMLERESLLMVPVHAIHRHASLWDAPHVFDPDRFLPDAVSGRPRHAFMPFGAGPRACVGAAFALHEAVVILSVLMRRLAFRSLQADAPKPRMAITLRPSLPIRMRVTAWELKRPERQAD